MARSALTRLRGLSAYEWRILVRTFFTLAFARVALKILPFSTVRRAIVPRPGSPGAPWMSIKLIRWAIDHAQRIIPDATCLPQALTAEGLLTRAGLPVLLRVGVLKDASGKFEAHAWAETGRIIVVGKLPGRFSDYTPMPPLPPAWSDSDVSKAGRA